jgi:hypothetical protein
MVFINRALLSFLTTFFCAFLALAFVIVAVATNEWIVLNTMGTKVISLGLWKACILNQCFTVIAIVPAVLTIVTVVLILISLIISSGVNIQKRFSSNIFFIPIIFFFVSIIILLATIAISWDQLLQHWLISKFSINDIIGGSKLNGGILNAVKSDGLNSNIITLLLSIVYGLDLSKINTVNSISLNHGFSSALFITALPLLLICLVISTFIAGFRKAESIAIKKQTYVDHADKY